jgi:hypothetical protein
MEFGDLPNFVPACQVAPRDPRTQEVVDTVPEAAEIPVRTHTHRRILAQQAEKNLACDGAQRVTGHGRGAVKRSATWQG